jgi:hypothetical protein
MLTEEEQDSIIRNMCVYEHEWRYLASYLGEPFLLEDILAFFDGRVLSICAFTLGDARQLSDNDFEERITIVDQSICPELVSAWGNVQLPEKIKMGGKELCPVTNSEEKYLGDYSIDIYEHFDNFSPEARKAIRSFKRDGLQTTISPSTRLSWRELDLIEKWRNRISPGIIGTIAGASISNFVLSVPSYTARCFFGKHLVGFSVFTKPSPDRAVNLMSFAERLQGIRIEDSLLHATIEACKLQNISRLHLGYAGTDSLASFKEKWGAKKTGPNYTQAIYVTGQEWENRAKDSNFFWLARLLQNATEDDAD